MKHYKKAALALFLALSLILSGCSAAPAKEDKPVTISIWHVYGGQTDSPLNDLIDEFNRTVGSENGIQLEVTMVSNNKNIHKDILASANGDPGASELPDIFVAYPSTVMELPDENILVDYRDYFSDEELSAFIPSFLTDGEVSGRLVTLPVAKSTELLFVNKTAFDRFSAATGAKMQDLTTWEGLFDTACKYADWTDAKTPDIADDAKSLLVHDFHFNYFQVGVESLGEDFFNGESIAFGPSFKTAWDNYARACLSGGVWLQGGYATEPLRMGESIVSVASSASVLYFSNQVNYLDNTSEEIELAVMPAPVFKNGEKMVMQRGAGMCTVKSTPEREKAAITFLKWLTQPEINTKFAVSTGYMPVTQAAFDNYLSQEIESLTEQKYIALYDAYRRTQADYHLYSAPKLENYLTTDSSFEEVVRRCMKSARENWLASDDRSPERMEQLMQENYDLFKGLMLK
ncbi:MAG: extracellular solute-binding protein [Oscillospiraceae bacterium]|nr:extracellular solute-binding protein [Oscillospiraceae bacterium]